MPKPFQDPQSLGQHLRKRCNELGLYLREAAIPLGVTPWTLMNWEKDRTEPGIRYWPAILDYLGYDPHPRPASVGERTAAARRRHGLSRKGLAGIIGVDEASVARWEWGQTMPRPDVIGRLHRFFGP